jgi:hypothetical protein
MGWAIESNKSAVEHVNNRCAHRYECTRRDICKACRQRRSMQCKFCRRCNSHHLGYIEDRCARLESSQFVCNRRKDRNRYTLRKRFYRNDIAMENYREVLVESRRGVIVTDNGIEFADLFNIRRISANDVVLRPSLLGIEQKVRPEIIKPTDPKNNMK